jgi:hypothetical protein
MFLGPMKRNIFPIPPPDYLYSGRDSNSHTQWILRLKHSVTTNSTTRAFENEKSSVLLTSIFVTPTFLSQGNNTLLIIELLYSLLFQLLFHQ